MREFHDGSKRDGASRSPTNYVFSRFGLLEKPKNAHFNRLPGPGQWLDTAHLFLVVTIWYVVAVEK